MRRRHLLATIAGGGMGGLAGCGVLSPDCPTDPIIDDSIPADRRSLEFLSEENAPTGIEPDGPPTIQFDGAASQVVIRGIFGGATPKSRFPKDMIVVNRLVYDEQADTLYIRLVERRCKSNGATVGGERTPYELRVAFPDEFPGEVCAQEGGRRANEDNIYNTCVSR